MKGNKEVKAILAKSMLLGKPCYRELLYEWIVAMGPLMVFQGPSMTLDFAPANDTYATFSIRTSPIGLFELSPLVYRAERGRVLYALWPSGYRVEFAKVKIAPVAAAQKAATACEGMKVTDVRALTEPASYIWWELSNDIHAGLLFCQLAEDHFLGPFFGVIPLEIKQTASVFSGLVKPSIV